jgi:hypothetical protein
MTDMKSINQKIFENIEKAWEISWSLYYREDTNLFYDYVSDNDPACSQAHLPTPDEVKQQFPNLCGWGTGMEDSAISAGVWMATICDRFDSTSDETMKKYADKVWEGMKLLMRVSKSSGFLPRSVCLADGISHYINSSRDQYTHYCHGIWRFYHSPLSDAGQRAGMRQIITDICHRMETNVIPENDFSFCQEDDRPGHGVNKMWENWGPHEWGRLPMIYAIGWDLTSDKHWRDMYQRYAWEAAYKSTSVPDNHPAYALQQAIFSFEPLIAIESMDSELRMAWLQDMKLYADAIQSYTKQCLEYTPVIITETDWRKWPTQDHGNGPCPTWPDGERIEDRTVREPAESILSQLMVPDRPLPADQIELFYHFLQQTKYELSFMYGLFYHVAVYWRAVKCGVLCI